MRADQVPHLKEYEELSQRTLAVERENADLKERGTTTAIFASASNTIKLALKLTKIQTWFEYVTNTAAQSTEHVVDIQLVKFFVNIVQITLKSPRNRWFPFLKNALATKLMEVDDNEYSGEFIDTAQFDEIIATLLSYGLIIIGSDALEITDYGQVQYGALTRSTQRDR